MWQGLKALFGRSDDNQDPQDLRTQERGSLPDVMHRYKLFGGDTEHNELSDEDVDAAVEEDVQSTSSNEDSHTDEQTDRYTDHNALGEEERDDILRTYNEIVRESEQHARERGAPADELTLLQPITEAEMDDMTDEDRDALISRIQESDAMISSIQQERARIEDMSGGGKRRVRKDNDVSVSSALSTLPLLAFTAACATIAAFKGA